MFILCQAPGNRNPAQTERTQKMMINSRTKSTPASIPVEQFLTNRIGGRANRHGPDIRMDSWQAP